MNEFEAAFYYGDFSSVMQKFNLEVVNDFWYNVGTDQNYTGEQVANKTTVD